MARNGPDKGTFTLKTGSWSGQFSDKCFFWSRVSQLGEKVLDNGGNDTQLKGTSFNIKQLAEIWNSSSWC